MHFIAAKVLLMAFAILFKILSAYCAKDMPGNVYIGITIGPVRKNLRLFSHRVCEWADNVRHFHTFFVVCFQKCNLGFERLRTSTFYKKHLKAH